jgi:hypothetical protein
MAKAALIQRELKREQTTRRADGCAHRIEQIAPQCQPESPA